jgi:hypothetical protein
LAYLGVDGTMITKKGLKGTRLEGAEWSSTAQNTTKLRVPWEEGSFDLISSQEGLRCMQSVLLQTLV